MEKTARPPINLALPNEVAQASTKEYQAYVTDGSEGPETNQSDEVAAPSSPQATTSTTQTVAASREEPCQSDAVVQSCQSDAVVQPCQSDIVVQANAKEEVRATTSPIATPQTTHLVQIQYKVIVSRKPKLVERSWYPRGAFQDYTMDRFKDEIGLTWSGGTQGIRCRLMGPGVDSTNDLMHGRDSQFECFKKSVKLAVKDGLRLTETDASGQDMTFHLVIEEWREGDQAVDAMSDDVDDMSVVIEGWE
ncbi:hypothetical protein NQ176_g11159 [Zarea fungicola]|uniref:Uncharacterized protein n=1 Tax=Zarea fungicola TaxID=93591 RepID=A0ACC1MDZ4_9HYPO|nr:hypothetical protein NQ176_g11159 [Lecanicillium fungicola]